MRILTGDETGLIKQVLIENKRIQRWGNQTRENSVERMVWAGPTGSEENEVAIAMRNGSINVWDVDKTEIVKTFSGLEQTPRGLGIIRENNERRVVACGNEGCVNLYKWDEEECYSTFDVKGPISHMRLCPSNNHIIAVGGRENDIALYDVETQDAVFKGRNVPFDFLNMRVPIWVADMQFLSHDNGYKLAVVTGYHHIRLYDTRAQRKPIQSIGERPFTTCCVTPDENYLIAGDTVGRVSRVDLRTLRLNGVYKGNTGSIRDIAIHPSMNMVATVGLDRIMRVFDIETRQQLHRVYLRQRLNCVLFSSEELVQCFAKEEESEKEEEEKESSDDLEMEEDEKEDDLEMEEDEEEEKQSSDDLEMEEDEEEEKQEDEDEDEDSDDSMLHDDDDAVDNSDDEELEEDSLSA